MIRCRLTVTRVDMPKFRMIDQFEWGQRPLP